MAAGRKATIHFQPRIRKGAFFDSAWRHGCRSYSVYNRTYISSTFGDPVAEYWQVVERVALWPAMGERQVEIRGTDASRFVQYLTPRDLSKMTIGQCKYALITSAEGGIISDPIILKLAEDRYWLSTADCDLELWARGVAVGAGMDIEIFDAQVSVLQVQGPKACDLLSTAFGDDIEQLKYFRFTRVDFDGVELVISRTGYSGERGYEIYLADASRGDRLFDHLLEIGRELQVAPGCISQARRIEAGMLSWGIDMSAEDNPYQVGLGRLVELEQGVDCVGKQALQRLHDEAPTRRLVGLFIAGEALGSNEDIWPLRANARDVGKLTSLAYSPGLQRMIGLGMVESEFADPGGAIEVVTPAGVREVTVATLPFKAKRQA